MSLPLVSTTFANPDPTTEIGSLSDLVDELNALVTSEIQGTYTPYVVSDSTPAVGDQDKIWIQLDAGGRPIAIKKFYGGSWRRVYSGKPFEVTMFRGDPATYFDGTGLGLTTGEWDGWALCNGNNSTPNLSSLFIVGGQMDNAEITGYSSGWQTNLTGSAAATGGNASYTLVNNNLPSMKVQLSGKSGYDDNASHSEKHAIVTGKWYGNGEQSIDVQSFGADPTGTPAVPQVAVPTVPPFYALAYVAWVGIA